MQDRSTPDSRHCSARLGRQKSATTGLIRCSKTASSFDQVVHADGHQPFAERTVTEYLAPSAVQSALMPTNLTTLPHFSVSSAMSLPKSAGELTNGAAPMSEMRAFLLTR